MYTFLFFILYNILDTTWIHIYDMIISNEGEIMKLLIVEDEQSIRELIRMNVTRFGYECICVEDGAKAIEMIDTHDFDLLLLDIMLPNVNGYEILEYVNGRTPIIFITAKGDIKDRVKGLHMGADDYLVKPFSIDELIARIESVLRRYKKSDSIFSIHDITINQDARTVTKDNKKIDLTKMEYNVLLYLIRNKNIALYREVIYQKLWHTDELYDTRTLDLHIQRLRKKLDWQDYIKTVYRIGYMLEV